MRRLFLLSVFFFGFNLLFFLCSPSAYAYLDPGTGSMILQAVLAAVVGSALAIKMFWKRIKDIFFSIFRKKTP